MIKTEKEALIYFAEALLRNLDNVDFTTCCLQMERQDGVTGFSAMFKDANEHKTSLRIDKRSELCEVIRDLYTITQTQPPIHRDWNKAVFTLYPDGKADMEYIWDAEMQAEIDKYNEEAKRKRNKGKK